MQMSNVNDFAAMTLQVVCSLSKGLGFPPFLPAFFVTAFAATFFSAVLGAMAAGCVWAERDSRRLQTRRQRKIR